MATASSLRHATLALALLASIPAPSAWARQSPGDDEILTEFKKYFRKYKDTPTRIESVLALAGCEDPEAMAGPVPLFDTAEPEVGLAATRVLSKFKTRPPVDKMLADLATASPAAKVGLLSALEDGAYANTQAGILPLLQDGTW